jgi:hypothetical protein
MFYKLIQGFKDKLCILFNYTGIGETTIRISQDMI